MSTARRRKLPQAQQDPVQQYWRRAICRPAQGWRRLQPVPFDWFGPSSRPANHALTQHFRAGAGRSRGLIEGNALEQVLTRSDDAASLQTGGPLCRRHPARLRFGGKPRGDQCDSGRAPAGPSDLIRPPISRFSGSKEYRDPRTPTTSTCCRKSRMTKIPRLGEHERQTGKRSLALHRPKQVARRGTLIAARSPNARPVMGREDFSAKRIWHGTGPAI